MQWSKQCCESKITIFLLKQMQRSCFYSYNWPSTTGYWLNLVMNSLRTLRCVSPNAKTMRMVCIIAPEEIVLSSATVRSCGCCHENNFNPCSCANKKSINDAVAPQSTIAKVLNSEIFLLTIEHSNMMWSHFVLATSALADINNFNLVGPQEQLYSGMVCFPICCLTIMPLCLTVLLSSCGSQPYGV